MSVCAFLSMGTVQPLASVLSRSSSRRASSVSCNNSVAGLRSCIVSTESQIRNRKSFCRIGRRRLQLGVRSAANPVTEVLLEKDKLCSLQIDKDIRQRVEHALEQLQHKGTVGDVAAKSGLDLSKTEKALQALAADAHGTLQVSNSGEILYVFPKNFKAVILGKSAILRAEPVLEGAGKVAIYLMRVAFGTTLIASVLIVWVSIMALLTAASSDRDDRDSRYRGSFPVFINLSDFFWYFDPFYYDRRRRQRQAKKDQELGFLEGVFSFVFGDGDPNAELDQHRWKLVGQYIQSKGGVVAAEELAPFLDSEPGAVSSALSNENYMMPVLVRFGGVPSVDAEGHVLYTFPTLQTTSKVQRQAPPAERAIQEAKWKLTKADGLTLAATVGLGVLNFVGVFALSSLLVNPSTRLAIASSSLAFVNNLLPWLKAYAVSFFALPLIRMVQNKIRNARINQRNEARLESLRAVAYPSAELQEKLLNARRQAETSVLRENDMVYRSDRDLLDQTRDLELDDFDKKLNADMRAKGTSASGVGSGGHGNTKGSGRGGQSDWREEMWDQARRRQRG